MFSLYNKEKIHLFRIFNHIFANLFLFLAYKYNHLFRFLLYKLARSRLLWLLFYVSSMNAALFACAHELFRLHAWVVSPACMGCFACMQHVMLPQGANTSPACFMQNACVLRALHAGTFYKMPEMFTKEGLCATITLIIKDLYLISCLWNVHEMFTKPSPNVHRTFTIRHRVTNRKKFPSWTLCEHLVNNMWRLCEYFICAILLSSN